MQASKARALAAGLCVDGCGRPLHENHVRCVRCLKATARRARQYRKRTKEDRK